MKTALKYPENMNFWAYLAYFEPVLEPNKTSKTIKFCSKWPKNVIFCFGVLTLTNIDQFWPKSI